MTTLIQKYTGNLPFMRHADIKHNTVVIGVVLAVLSNVLFGVLYAYGKWMSPLSGTQMFLWRMVMMWACLALFLAMTGKMAEFRDEIGAIRGVKSWLYVLVPTPILASQLWLFMWAPVNGQSIQVSMGYFLFPLAMVLAGFLVFRERLSRLQSVAVEMPAECLGFEI